MEQTSIPNQQTDSKLPGVNTSFITVLSNTEKILKQDYNDYGVIFNNGKGWLEFFKQNYTQAIVNILVLPPGYDFANADTLNTMMDQTSVSNDNPLVVYGDYITKHEEYNENIYLPTMSQGNSSAQFLQGIPILIYRNDMIQAAIFKENIYQIFNAILSIHIPQTLFYKKD